MQFRVGGRGSGKTQNLLNDFLDDGLANSVFVCFNRAEAERIKQMVKYAAEASEVFPKGFKKVSKKTLLAKVSQVKTMHELFLRSSRGRGYLYIDNLDMALQVLASSKGYEIKAATIEG